MKRNNLDLWLVALCGLVPFFWFSNGELLKCEDLRLPFTWDQWKSLFYVWHHGFNTGSELILDNCLIPIMFFPALLQKWGLSLFWTERVLFVVWFVLPGLSMAYLLRTIYQGPGALVFRIGGLSFYLFNLWLENVWIAFKPPLISAYAFVPLILALIIRILRGQFRLPVGLALFFVVSFLSSGMGNNSSEFGASFAPGLILLGAFFVRGKTWRNPGLFRNLLGRALLLGATWFVASLYWFLPQWAAIYRDVILKMTGEIVNVSDLVTWLNGMSLVTSFTNVIRTQADWTWSQGCVDPYRSYSALFHSNIFFVGLSWVVPIFVFLGLWNKEIRYRGYFIFLTVAGVLLSMGTHPPFGFVYAWLTQHLPLFWIFRSPYLKFYLWVCLGYSVFFGAACLLIRRWFSKMPAVGTILIGLLCLSNLVYAFPITTGRIFHSAKERTFLPPNRFKIPDYVFEAAKWVDAQPSFFRIFPLPGDNPSIYTWGATNFGSFIKDFSEKNLAFAYDPQQTLIAQGPLNQSRELLTLIRDQIYNETTWYAADLLSLLQARYILQEKDIRFDFYKGPGFFEGDDPKFIEEKIKAQKGVAADRAFGLWQFYTTEKGAPFIYATAPENAVLIRGPLSLLTWWTYQEPSPQLPALFLDPAEKIIQALPAALKIGWDRRVFATRELPAEIIPGSDGNLELRKKVSMEISNLPPAENLNGAAWIWWDGNQNKIFFTNRGEESVEVSFSFRALSWEMARSLYLQQGNKILQIMEMPANEEKDVRVPHVVLPPGKSELHFYSPFAQSNRNGRGVTFAFQKDSFLFGIPSYEIAAKDLGQGKMRVRVYPMNMKPLAKEKIKTQVGDRSFFLTAARNTRKAFYEGEIVVSDGKSGFTAEQEDPENDFVEIAPEPAASLPVGQPPPKLIAKTLSPALYQVDVEAAAPFVLVLSESFHPCWKAYSASGGKKRFFEIHGKVNGFANGYFIDQTGKFSVRLEFTPQRLFQICQAITAAGLALSLALLFFGFLFPARK